jgi:hypothetical protein
MRGKCYGGTRNLLLSAEWRESERYAVITSFGVGGGATLNGSEIPLVHKVIFLIGSDMPIKDRRHLKRRIIGNRDTGKINGITGLVGHWATFLWG